MNPILSVVIPVYKVEDYLERCVKSVLNQDASCFYSVNKCFKI